MEESMMCRNDKSRVGPRWKYNTSPQFLNIMKGTTIEIKYKYKIKNKQKENQK